MSANTGDINHRDVQRRFNRAAAAFDGADFVHEQTFAALLDRLQPVVVAPSVVLDLGAGTGKRSRKLAKHYRKSRVIALDMSPGMLRIARKEKGLFSKQSELLANAKQIPLRSGSVDLVFANLLLPWIDDLQVCFAEVARVLRKGGVFVFATLGPDSLGELRAAWPDAEPHVVSFPDMHDVGDALMRHGLAEPVLDVDYLTITYKEIAALYRDLSACGARNSLAGRRRTLTGKDRLRKMEQALGDAETQQAITITLELVFGHAWGSGPRAAAGEFHLDPSKITRRGR